MKKWPRVSARCSLRRRREWTNSVRRELARLRARARARCAKWIENLCEVRPRDANVRHAVTSWPTYFRQEVRPEQAVEDGKVDGKVLVDGLGLGSVVEMVVAGRHQEGFEPLQTRTKIGVDEDRVEGHEGQVERHRRGGRAGEDQDGHHCRSGGQRVERMHA